MGGTFISFAVMLGGAFVAMSGAALLALDEYGLGLPTTVVGLAVMALGASGRLGRGSDDRDDGPPGH